MKLMPGRSARLFTPCGVAREASSKSACLPASFNACPRNAIRKNTLCQTLGSRLWFGRTAGPLREADPHALRRGETPCMTRKVPHE